VVNSSSPYYEHKLLEEDAPEILGWHHSSVKKISEHRGISMSLSNLIRWAGLLAVVGVVLNIIIDLNVVLAFGQESAELLPFVSLPFLVRFVLVFAMDVLLLLGLVGLYARASEATDILGLVGFLAAFVGWE
jgi:hypothetical protein